MPDLKPWPNDVFIVLCERWGSENIFNMSDMVQRNCMDCNAVVSLDPKTILGARGSRHRYEREIKYLCAVCGDGYDPKSVTMFITPKEMNDQHRATEAKS